MPGVTHLIPLMPALREHRWVTKFKAHLVHMLSSRSARAIYEILGGKVWWHLILDSMAGGSLLFEASLVYRVSFKLARGTKSREKG